MLEATRLGTVREGLQVEGFGRPADDLDGLTLKAGLEGKAKMSLKGKGANIAMPGLGAVSLPVTTQLQSENGECYEAMFSSTGVKVNTTTLFKAKSD